MDGFFVFRPLYRGGLKKEEMKMVVDDFFDDFFDECCLGYDDTPDTSWMLFHDVDDPVFFVAGEVLCLTREGW